MSVDLRESLRDLAGDVPGDLDTTGLARTAWRAGRRRRFCQRLVVTGTAAALVAVVVGVGMSVTQAPRVLAPAGPDSSPHVQGFPRRVLHQWWTPNLPARPGPVAGLVKLRDLRWDVVSEQGHLWRLPVPPQVAGGDYYPTLSPNGRFLGYLTGRLGPYVVHDTVTGRQRAYPSVGSGSFDPKITTTGYWLSGQTPGFWSPDSSRVLLWGGLRADVRGTEGNTVLLGRDGSVRLLRTPLGWNPAGWATAGHLVWTAESRRAQGGGPAVTVHVTDLAGHPVRELTLRLPNSVAPDSVSQWSWTVSPNGRQLLLTSDPIGADSGDAVRYSLADGTRLGVTSVPGVSQPCSSGWAGTTPVVPVLGPRNEARTVTAVGGQRLVSVTDPFLHADCLLWASDALSGTPHAGAFGTATVWWTWWWREAIAALVALAVSAALIGAVRARRSSSTP